MQEEYNREEGFDSGLGHDPSKIILNKGQKIAVAVLAFFGVLIIFVWGIQLKNRISAPFEYRPQNSNQAVQDSQSVEDNSEEAMRTKDTDGDGLTDWDELNIYMTSPYLEDSDSDGYSDSQEISSENDPNCPIGRDCYGVAGESLKTTNSKEDLNLNEIINNNTANTNNETEVQGAEKLFEGNLSSHELRQLLVNTGMNEQLLNQLTDKQLMDSYNELLEQGK